MTHRSAPDTGISLSFSAALRDLYQELVPDDLKLGFLLDVLPDQSPGPPEGDVQGSAVTDKGLSDQATFQADLTQGVKNGGVYTDPITPGVPVR